MRNSPPPVVYPSSLNLRPYGVSAGKSVWQVPQGCPVCRAKLGSACAGEENLNRQKERRHSNNANAANVQLYRSVDDTTDIAPHCALSRVYSASCRRTNPTREPITGITIVHEPRITARQSLPANLFAKPNLFGNTSCKRNNTTRSFAAAKRIMRTISTIYPRSSVR